MPDAASRAAQMHQIGSRANVCFGSKGDTHQWRRSGGRDGDNGEGFSVGKVDLVANLGPEHRPDQGGGEADACVDRIALVVADDLDGPGLAVALVGDPSANRDALARRRRGHLGARLAGTPVAQVAHHRLALLFRKWIRQVGLEFGDTGLDKQEPARCYEVGAGWDGQLELGLEMLLVTLATEGDAHWPRCVWLMAGEVEMSTMGGKRTSSLIALWRGIRGHFYRSFS